LPLLKKLADLMAVSKRPYQVFILERLKIFSSEIADLCKISD